MREYLIHTADGDVVGRIYETECSVCVTFELADNGLYDVRLLTGRGDVPLLGGLSEEDARIVAVAIASAIECGKLVVGEDWK